MYYDEDELDEWKEMYYSLFGIIRNECRAGGTAKQRLDNIFKKVEQSRKKHMELERKYEADTD